MLSEKGRRALRDELVQIPGVAMVALLSVADGLFIKVHFTFWAVLTLKTAKIYNQVRKICEKKYPDTQIFFT